MPIIDDLTEAIRSGRVNPSDHVIVLHPQDFEELRRMIPERLPATSFDDMRNNFGTFMGFQVHVDQHVPRGRFIMYPRVPSPLFMSDQMMTPIQREAITSFRPPAQPKPKTLWEHLEDDDGDE